jgi:hypothetical protein
MVFESLSPAVSSQISLNFTRFFSSLNLCVQIISLDIFYEQFRFVNLHIRIFLSWVFFVCSFFLCDGGDLKGKESLLLVGRKEECFIIFHIFFSLLLIQNV